MADPLRYYLSTKLLAFIAMVPFLIITNSFFSHGTQMGLPEIILVNSVSFVGFIALSYGFQRTGKWKFTEIIFGPLEKRIINPYIRILVKIFFWVIIISTILGIFTFSEIILKYIVAIFMFTSSAIVFRLLFYSNEVGAIDEEATRKILREMTGTSNRRHSRILYRWIIWSLLAVTLYYYLVPSLERTSALYILLIVFSFFIIYLDYWRNVITNRNRWWKTIGFISTALFLIVPFISHDKQFRILFQELPKDIPQSSLEDELVKRIEYINARDSSDNIYIVCAMGGGSRAGYITAAVLNKLDSINPNLRENTLCYSTISGGSVGLYAYIKGRELDMFQKDTDYLANLYDKNYNSSGVYGLLVGDAIETIFGSIATIPKSWIARETPAAGFFDRNYRIRQEYDYVFQEATSEETDGKYLKRTFYPWFRKEPFHPDSFRTYHYRHEGEIPIHLVNTFEINSGQRTVLCPYPAGLSFFPNAILPLQDKGYDSDILHKDLTYREAVNLSELFPIVSAASHLGGLKDAQFVDGGYYENYGLATALDVVYFLKFHMKDDFKRLKILLIKNSPQEAPDSGQQVQYLAPLIGALNSPFTGHANHLLAESRRVIDSANLHVITFEADQKKVPLTRALTTRHIDSMNSYVKYLHLDTMLRKFLDSSSFKPPSILSTGKNL